jgi:hypothetical protein
MAWLKRFSEGLSIVLYVGWKKYEQLNSTHIRVIFINGMSSSVVRTFCPE